MVAYVPEEVTEKKAGCAYLTDYLEGQLRPYGIRVVDVAMAPVPVEIARLMRQGKVDVFMDTIFSSYIVSKLTDAEFFLSHWKKSVQKYHSTIFTRSDAGMSSLDDLKGRMIAFEDPGSTSAYFLPKAELLVRGYTLTEKAKPTARVPQDEIGYYFARTDEKVVEDVVNGVAAAGGQRGKCNL